MNPFEWFGMQRNATNTGNMITLVPSNGNDTILGFKGSTRLVAPFYFGNRISLNGSGFIDVSTSGIPQSDIAGLTTALTGKQPVAANLTNLASSTIANDELLMKDGSGVFVGITITTLGQSMMASASTSALKGVIFAGGSSSQFVLADGSSRAIVATDISDSTALGQSLMTAASASLARTAIGAGTSSFSGAYSSLTGIPTFATVATTGAYSDLTGLPTIPAAQVNSDWNAISGLAQILNKPSLATVATTGAYTDLTGLPTLGTAASQNSTVFATAAQGVLATNAVPQTTTVNGHALSANVTVTKSDVGLSNVDNTSDANKPVSTAQAASIATKFTIPTGTTAQYVRGDGTLATLPSPGSGTVTSIVAGAGLSGGTITATGTISMPNTGTAGTYSGVTTDAQGRVTAGTTRSFSYSARTLNTAFQPSATRDVLGSYSVDVATSLSLTGGQTGTVVFEIADDSGFTTNVQTVQSTINANTGTLTIGLALTQTATASLTGVIPAAKYARLRTVNTTGTPTFTFRNAQEVIL